jgi:hypothetical protein
VVLAHAHQLLTTTPQGAANYVQADLHDPQDILEQAAETLDLSAPVAVTLVSMLHFLDDHENPQGIVDRLVAAVPSGSHLVISHITADMQPDLIAKLVEAPGDQASYTFVPRTRGDLSRFFQDLELIEPGIAPMSRWLPSDTDSRSPSQPTSTTTAPSDGNRRRPSGRSRFCSLPCLWVGDETPQM